MEKKEIGQIWFTKGTTFQQLKNILNPIQKEGFKIVVADEESNVFDIFEKE